VNTRPDGRASVATPPGGIPVVPPTPTWLTTADVAERAQRSISTVNAAAVSGELHGHQSTRNGRPIRKGKWLFHTDATDAWIHGLDARAQAVACGCPATTRRGRTR
jgi:hypothetical protein